MAESRKAVFLSYASEDAEAARLICDALRAAGVEVWFDQSELRGGDSWDHAIRRQIHECALFVAVISAHTNERDEGYFRREWNLAVERTADMASDKPFLLPVVIDNTPDATARVPEKFHHIQWTRLNAEHAQPAFVERVIRLLLPAPEPQGRTHSPILAASDPIHVAPRSWNAIPWLIGAVSLVTLAYIAPDTLIASRRHSVDGNASVPTPQPAATGQSAAPEKSIAVLPFVDMSEKQDQEYLSDGLSEELIDHLSHSADLKVIARTSSFAFKGKNEDIRAIAMKLGVAHLLEGSVRKSGSELRITAQLIRASDGFHLWSHTYERKLKDIFKLQDEIAATVAKALNAVLSVAAGTSRHPDPNIEAYNSLLKGEYFFNRGNTGDNDRAIEQYKRALELDPGYALAWTSLADAYIRQGQYSDIPNAEARSKAWDAVQRAVAINANSAEAHGTLGAIHVVFDWDWAAAQAEFEKAAALHAAAGDYHSGLFALAELKAYRTGQFANVIEVALQAAARSPLDTGALVILGYLQYLGGHLEESAATYRRLLDLNSTYAGAQANYASILSSLGRDSEALAAAQQETDELARLGTFTCLYWTVSRRPESDAALRLFNEKFALASPYSVAQLHACRGEANAALDWLQRAYQRRDGSMMRLMVDPDFKDLRNDLRYQALLRKMKLAET